MKTEQISGNSVRKPRKLIQVNALLLAAALLTAQPFRGTAFAAPATTSNAAVSEPQGEVFVSPDFIWNEEVPGEFQIRGTITNGSDTVIPETEVRITLPDAALRFDADAAFSGQEPPSGTIMADGRELLLELTDFQIGESYAFSVSGNADDAVGADDLPGGAQEQRYSPGAMNISLVLRGYGEEHATALDYRIPDLILETEEVPETAEEVPETRTLMMLSASLTGTGRGLVTADTVEAPLSRAAVSMNKNNEYSLNNIHFRVEKEAGGHSDSPFSMLRLLPFLTAGCTLLILYVLYCIRDVRRRARALKFDPLVKTNEKS